MSALPQEDLCPQTDGWALLQSLQEARAIILTDGPPPFKAVPQGDKRRMPVAWVSEDLIAHWRQAGYAVRCDRGWRLLDRPGPRPIRADADGRTVQVEVRENWMQRLARDLELPGPLSEAGLRLVADGLRMEVGSYRSGTAPVVVDGRPRNSDGEEMRTIRRLDARKRVRDALECLSRRERNVADAICLRDHGLEDVMRTQRMGEVEARDAFVLALVKLARFYGTMPGLKPRRAPRPRR